MRSLRLRVKRLLRLRHQEKRFVEVVFRATVVLVQLAEQGKVARNLVFRLYVSLSVRFALGGVVKQIFVLRRRVARTVILTLFLTVHLPANLFVVHVDQLTNRVFLFHGNTLIDKEYLRIEYFLLLLLLLDHLY